MVSLQVGKCHCERILRSNLLVRPTRDRFVAKNASRDDTQFVATSILFSCHCLLCEAKRSARSSLLAGRRMDIANKEPCATHVKRAVHRKGRYNGD